VKIGVAHATGNLLKAALLLGFAMSIGYFSTTLCTVFVDIQPIIANLTSRRAWHAELRPLM
jgi:hypothetical protein